MSDAQRRRLYKGERIELPATEASLALVEEVRGLLTRTLGSAGPIEQAQFRLEPRDWFARITQVRRTLTYERRYVQLVRAVIASCGVDERELMVDWPRLRAVAHDGDQIAAAAPAYYAHRDTWYGNPQTQINWWIPLHDVRADETFVFYPELFKRPVANDSERFDYNVWARELGFQNPKPPPDAVYPQALESMDSQRAEGFSARAGEILLFSAAHLHRTLGHSSGRTRFSLDFRTVHVADHASGLGAPNVDNRSQGSTLIDYPPREVL